MNIHTRDMRPYSQRPGIGFFASLQARAPVGIWTFAESAGITAVDHSGFGHHASFIGGVRRVAGSEGHAIELDGVSQYASAAHSPALMPKQITVAVKTRNLVTPAQYDVIIMKSTDSNWADGFGLFYASPGTVVRFFVGNYSTGGVASASLTPTADSIIVGTYDGAAARVFVNGAEGTPATYSGGITTNTAPLEFGRGRSNDFNINGRIHWVQIYDYPLPTESARLLSAGVSPWSMMNPMTTARSRTATSLAGVLNLTASFASGDGIRRLGTGDGIARSGGKA